MTQTQTFVFPEESVREGIFFYSETEILKALQKEATTRNLPFKAVSLYHKHRFPTGLRLNCRICGVALNFIRKQRGTYLASTIYTKHVHGPEQFEAKKKWYQRCQERNHEEQRKWREMFWKDPIGDVSFEGRYALRSKLAPVPKEEEIEEEKPNERVLKVEVDEREVIKSVFSAENSGEKTTVTLPPVAEKSVPRKKTEKTEKKTEKPQELPPKEETTKPATKAPKPRKTETSAPVPKK